MASMPDILTSLLSGTVVAIITIAYQRHHADKVKLREVYSHWGGAMRNLLISHTEATRVNERMSASSDYVEPSFLLAQPENRSLLADVDRDRRLVFRYECELMMLEQHEQYRSRMHGLTRTAANVDHDRAADPELPADPIAEIDQALDKFLEELRGRWAISWPDVDEQR
jgi:hypothetical protein